MRYREVREHDVRFPRKGKRIKTFQKQLLSSPYIFFFPDEHTKLRHGGCRPEATAARRRAGGKNLLFLIFF